MADIAAWALVIPVLIVGLGLCWGAYACARDAADNYEPYDPEGR